jgi:hypothetical protein
LIGQQVGNYRPDLLLVGLGFNDMGWFVSGPQGTLDSVKTLVDQARAARPDIKFALANVPQRTRIGGREDLPVNTDTYNQMLADAIPSWSTANSPVALVDWRGNYSCGLDSCSAGYDGLHPNALGEYQIAQALERTLHNSYRLGAGVPDLPVVIAARPTPVPGNVTATSNPGGVTVTWDPVFGALGYTVRSRLVGAVTWNESRASANRFDTTWTVDGMQWEYQVRTDAWSHHDPQAANHHTPIQPKDHQSPAARLSTVDVHQERRGAGLGLSLVIQASLNSFNAVTDAWIPSGARDCQRCERRRGRVRAEACVGQVEPVAEGGDRGRHVEPGIGHPLDHAAGRAIGAHAQHRDGVEAVLHREQRMAL